MTDSSLTVIGAGIGGLAASAYLADAGYDVQILEQNGQVGGLASVFEADGFRFDMGPSWYLMPDVFDRFFGHFDSSPEEYYDLKRLDPHYRVFFKDGDRVDITGDVERTAALFEEYEDGAEDAFFRYLDAAEHSYEVGMEHFVYTDRGRFRDYIGLDVVKHARGLRLLSSMQSYVEEYFSHPKLHQLAQYTLVFLGGSPTNTPALYNLMSHVDHNLGVFYPPGGMGEVIDGMATLAEEHGVTIETDTTVTRIQGSRGNFTMTLDSGRTLSTDIVLSNANVAHTEQELLPPDKRQYDADYWESRTYAPSAYMLYLGLEGDVEPLEHHTLVLPEDWSDHFTTIFDEPAWPDDPAYYVSVPSVTDSTVAPAGHSTVVVLVPIAPGLADDQQQRNRFRDQILTDLTEYTGVKIRDRIVFERDFAVSDFADRYNAPAGTALGLAHTLRQTGPFRPDHRSSAVDGLYFTGGFTRPGIGVPMCLISGEHAAQTILADR